MKLNKLFLMIATLTTIGNAAAMHHDLSDSDDEETVQKQNLTNELIGIIRNSYGYSMQDFCNTYEKVRTLLNRGANPNGNEDGIPLLIAAAQYKYMAQPQPYDLSAIVHLLLEHGADPNKQDSRLETTSLIESSGFNVTKILLAHGANPNIINKLGHSALSTALYRDDFKTANLLLTHNANPNLALSLMSFLGSLHKVEFLLEQGAEPDFAHEHEATLLVSSIYQRKSAFIRMLLQAGANPRQKNNRGKSALQIAHEQLEIADSDELRAEYLAIIEMLNNPHIIQRSGLKKLT